jgi:predicted ATPase
MYIDRKEKNQIDEFVFRAVREKIGSTIVLTGEPGIGKTTFMKNYLETLNEKDTFGNIKNATGSCSDIDGVSNSYLPWKEALIELDVSFCNTGDKKQKESFRKIVGSVIDENGTDWIRAIPQIGGIGAGIFKAVKVLSKKNQIDISSGEQTGISVSQRIKNAVDEAGSDLLGAIPVFGGLAVAIHKTAKTVLKNSNTVTLKNQEDFFIMVMNKLRKLAESHTLIIFFDDLQWADLSTLNLFFYVAKNLNDKSYPLVLIASYRPQDVKEGRLNAMTGKYDRHPLEEKLNNLARYNAVEEIKIINFSEEQIEKFLDDSYPLNNFTLKFKKEIINLTEGNAFFLKETLENLTNMGFIYRENGKFKNNEKLDASLFPKTIEGVIKEKYERLPDELQEILQIASTMGIEFSVDLLKRILEENEIKYFRNIELLQNKYNLIDTNNEIIDKLTKIYKFNHNLVQKYIYYNINTEIRTDYHKIIARNIKNTYGNESLSNIIGIYAFHFGLGNKIINEKYQLSFTSESLGKTIPREIVMEFLEYQQERAGIYEKSYSSEDAINTYDLIIQLSCILDIEVNIVTYSIKKAEMLMMISKWKESEYILKQCVQEHKDRYPPQKANCLNLLGRLFELKGLYNEALTYLNEARILFEELKDEIGISKVLGNIGMVYKNKGDYDTALTYYDQQLKKCESLNDLKGVALSTGNIGIIYYELGKYDSAMDCYLKQTKIYEQINDKSGLSYVLGNMGIICFQRREYMKAQEYYSQQIKICEEIGDRRGISRALGNIGALKLENNEYEIAVEYIDKQIVICEEIGDEIGLIYSYLNKGIICLDKKNLSMAKDLFEKSLKRSSKIGDKKGVNLSTKFLDEINL